MTRIGADVTQAVSLRNGPTEVVTAQAVSLRNGPTEAVTAQAVSLRNGPTEAVTAQAISLRNGPTEVVTAQANSLRYGHSLLFFGLVVLAGWLANVWRVEAVYLLIAACLLLPLLDHLRTGLTRALAWPRQGWGWALGLTGLAIGGIVLLFAVVRAWQGAALQMPAETRLWAFVGGQLLLWLPLAFVEEFFFRGYLQESVGRALWGERRIGPDRLGLSLKNGVTALLFGLAHALAQVSVLRLGTVLSGLLFGGLVERSRGSIWPAVALHAGLNVAGALLWLLLELNYPLIAGWLM